MRRAVYFDYFVDDCPYFNGNVDVNNGYGCDHPEQEERDFGQGKCYCWSCPLGYPADEESLLETDIEWVDGKPESADAMEEYSYIIENYERHRELNFSGGRIVTRYEVISKDYISNCLIEVIKAKMRNPQVKIYFCRPRITENGNFQSLHFMWEDENGSYDFSEPEAAGLPPWKQFLFKGHIRKFKKGFAEKYAAYRNGIKL